MTVEQQRALASARARQRAKQPAYSGAILPFSRSESGDVSFDSNAGLLGALKRTFSLPGEIYRGEVPTQVPDQGTSPELIDRAAEAAAMTMPMNPAVRSGERAIAGAAQSFRKVEPKVPTSQEISAAGSAGYNAARDMGVDFSSAAVADMASGLRARLEGDGILEALAPKSYGILKLLERPPEGSVAPLSGLDAARKALRNASQDFANPTEQLAASRIIKELDRFTEGPDPATVVAGPAAAAGELLKDARGNIAASKRSDRLTGVEDAADLRATSANSGRNLDNSIRSRIASLLLNQKARSGYSPEELKAIEAISLGSFGRNRLRDLGNLLGGGGGLGQAITGAGGVTLGLQAGGAPGALMGASLPFIGVGSKAAANALTRRSLERADEMVRKRSPLFKKLMEEAPSMPESVARREAMLKLLLASQTPNNGGGGF